MSEQYAAVRLLREEIGNLIKTVPGPVASVSLRLGECTLEVSWAHGQAPAAVPQQAPAAPVEEADDPALHSVTAPVVGTFYVAPEPGAPPFVQVGDRVSAGQTIGIVEAMKLMNPVKTERAGEVVEVVAGNADPVEFDQVLVLIRSDET
ncbi:acetyl-CoA carboxylase biotin carboxyl carrier protein [Nonomuraea candida]|uniref:acetyl-CoA carboxylase biotin carboxyl carrier protein n=1 Tax=Nonomuraea candida TaxID=359159 RepID=UPI0005BD6787|nr:acetyl-CoA carboxylase biotin carboxyl carrier protein [Nonomuraea candida]